MDRYGGDKPSIMRATGHATESMFKRYRKVDDTDLNKLIEADRRSKQISSDKEVSGK